MLHQQLVADAGEKLKVFNILRLAEIKKFLQYVCPLFISWRSEMVSGDQHPFPVPYFSAEAVKIINQERGCGIMAENEIQRILGVVILGCGIFAGTVRTENLMRVGIRAFHGKVKPQAH